MPINTEYSNIDFVWSNDKGDNYSMRLHRTPSYGWTVSILDDYGEITISFPHDMFFEVCDYIRPYINKTSSDNKQEVAVEKNRVNLSSSVSFPIINKKVNKITEPTEDILEDVSQDISPIQSFTSVPSVPSAPLDPEESSRILSERNKAKNNPNRKSGIKRVE